MRNRGWTSVVMSATVALGVTVSGQKTTPVHDGRAGSPHIKTEWVVDGANIAIEYGRPSIKGRPEADLMPAGKPWRTGADEATVITTDKALTFGSINLTPGTYTINTEPGDKGWQLIFGKLGKPGQWGIPYNASLEIGRTPMTLSKTKAPVEQLTIHIDDLPKGAALRVEWGTKSASAPFGVN